MKAKLAFYSGLGWLGVSIIVMFGMLTIVGCNGGGGGGGTTPDTTAPVTSASPGDTYFYGSLIVTLTCTDTGGSGCDVIHYTTDNTDPTVSSPIYSGPITLTVTTTLKYFSVDNADNQELFQISIYTLDNTAPISNATPPSQRFNDSLSVALNCADVGGSGCNETYFTTDGTDPTTASSVYSSTISIFTTTTLKFFSVDNVGNQEAFVTETYTLDTTPPTVINPQPTVNATDVALRTTEVIVEFSEAMNPNSINEETFTLLGPFGNIPGAVSYDDANNTATLTLSESLVDNVTYTALITTAAQDLAGNPMMVDYSWSFDSANIAWFSENGAIVKISSAQEELLKIDHVNCQTVSSVTQFALDERDGSLWVSDTNRNRLFKLNQNGKLLALIDQISVQGAAVDSRDGSIWSSELNTSRKLIKRDALGLPILETAAGLSGSMMDNAMTWYEGDNSLWFADYSSNVVKLSGSDAELSGYDLSGVSGTNHLRIGGFVGQPFTVSAYPGETGEGHVWVADRGGAVVQLAINGAELLRRMPAGFFEVWHVSADIFNGSVWAMGSPDRVAKYSAAGVQLVNRAGFSAPISDIDADPFDGGAWVGYSGGLVKLTSSGVEEWRRGIGSVRSVSLKTTPSLSRTIYVSNSGDDINGDGSLDNAYSSIGVALAVAITGDTVQVEAGSYNENITLISGVDIVGDGADVTTIQGLGTTHVVDGAGVNDIILAGFTITGSSDTTSGVYCADCANIIVRQNNIVNNGNSTTSNGVSIGGFTTAIVEQNLISGNASSGISIGGTSVVLVRNNIIVNNEDNGIYHNSADPSYIINNVIDSNGAVNGRSGILTWENDVISNNIITNNGWAANPNNNSVGIYVVNPATPTLSYNNVYGNAQGSYVNASAGTGDISADPLFSVADYQLQPGSPSENTGDPTLYDAGIDCSASPANRSDMGAYGGQWGNW